MPTEMARGALHEVVRWRRERLAESDFPLTVAARLAEDARYDLHALIELVERGCRPELAVRIVAPLDDEVAVDAPLEEAH
jgi:hypothetical protein